ncbi:membrane-associated phospholipid phosphatase [Vibrio sp. RC586]|uniref:phosphatase PAP2 family protein n=1 Tax=Vibrio sp. RC586 TaxID=675815 RepID=UPI0001BB7CA2|nr:phosphatase PAP2 family protein [Vibrio sp. RC586]EEY98968.1 membrane-associated phospholipid phosphatase [Vibrio sp. RC586]
MRVIQPIAKLDLAFSLFCLQHRYNMPVARLSKSISHTGDGHLYAVMGLLAWWLDSAHGLIFLTLGLLSFAIELPIYWVLKNSFQRRRPQEFSSLVTAYITPSDRYSLPSGHTAAAFVMATLIGYIYPHWYALAIIWAGLIGFARVLLGVHFVSDVLAGALLGIGSATYAITVVEKAI